MSANENNLIWIDLEMTGLDPERDRIIEIATLVTDANLNILAEGPTIAVHQSDAQLALMDEWNVRTHTGSGLVDRVKASTVSEHDAELATIEFLKQWVPAGKAPLCGNSIAVNRDRALCAARYTFLRYLNHFCCICWKSGVAMTAARASLMAFSSSGSSLRTAIAYCLP